MAWWQRRKAIQQAGSVAFRGGIPPRLENFSSFAKHEIAVEPGPPRDEMHWSADLTHPLHGVAHIWCPRDAPLPPPVLFDDDPRLTPEERAAAKLSGSMVTMIVPARSGNVLRDRKDLLWFLRAVMADDGLVAIDHFSEAAWSRDGLNDELAHDAELDIDAVYTLHMVYGAASEGVPPSGEEEDPERSVYWLHSHGLKELDFWDFDILSPTPDFCGRGSDTLRAIAFAIVEERLKPDGDVVPIIAQAPLRAVPARACLATLQPGEYKRYRDSVDAAHIEGHAIICDPPSRGLLARLFSRSRPCPSRFFQAPAPDDVLVHFSTSATNLMAQRARQTLGVLHGAIEEFRELELPALAKLGYAVDGGGADEREHLWFEVHGFEGESIDATLLNKPVEVSSLEAGRRGLYPLELLSDWALMTPAGNINPRQTRTLRQLRMHRAEMLDVMRRHRAAGQDGV